MVSEPIIVLCGELERIKHKRRAKPENSICELNSLAAVPILRSFVRRGRGLRIRREFVQHLVELNRNSPYPDLHNDSYARRGSRSTGPWSVVQICISGRRFN